MNTTPADIVRMLFDDLDAWARAQSPRGVVSLTSNPYDLLEMLGQRPSGWRLTIHWEGDAPADERVRAVGVVRNRLRFILDGALGPTALPKAALFRTTAGRAPFLDLLHAVRERILSYRVPWLREPNNRFIYRGADDNVPLPEGYALAAYNLSFELFSTIAEPSTTVEIPHEDYV